MNAAESTGTFRPKQALEPTPAHYSTLVGDGMERLAAVSLAQVLPIPAGPKILDAGCGPGAATAAVMAAVSPEVAASINIVGIDILDAALDSYRTNAAASSWTAEAINMDANSLSFPDGTFSHCIANALLFIGLRNDSIDAVKEMYRTLKPGGVLVANSMAHTPTVDPLREASRATRPPGAPLPRQGLDHWQDPKFLAGVLESGGFEKEKVTVRQCEYFVNISNFDQFPSLLWSFIGGTTSAGWTKDDEERWDEAVEIVKQELYKTEGFKALDNGKAVVRFVANVAIATK